MAPPRKSVLITGCSEGGIGWHLCVAFAAAGCRVYATARRVEAMQGLEAHGVSCLQMDVCDEASVARAVATVVEQAGCIDVLVNNAGAGCAGPLAETPLAKIRACYETNVFALLAVTQAVVPSMAARRSGTIVNIASVVGAVGTPFAGAYSSSKAAVINASDVLRIELAPFGVRVLTVCPGAIRSRFGANTAGNLDASALRLYAPFRAAVEARATASQSEKSTPGEAFAAEMVRQVLRPSAPPVLWIGHMAAVFRFMRWLPCWARDALLARRFGLNCTVPTSA